MEQFKIVECQTLESANYLLRKHECETGTRFTTYASSKKFGETSLQSARKVYWEDQPSVTVGRQDFTNVPFVVLGYKLFDCQFGPDRKKSVKQSRQTKVDGKDHDYSKGKKFLLFETKKLDCPARCRMREICRFPSYKIEENLFLDKKVKAEDLFARLLTGEDIQHERVIITCLAEPSAHVGHDVGTNVATAENIDKKVAAKIHQLVHEGTTDPGVIRTQLRQYVLDLCQPELPHPTNKRFYPSDKTIRNHVYMGKMVKLSDDQEKLCEWITSIYNKDDFVYCRLKCNLDEAIRSNPNKAIQYGEKFLFIYQSAQQRRLLDRYGSMVFLDATYKTTVYDAPLFFLAVKTNVDYQVVGAFITEDETTVTIAEALTILKKECFLSNPPYFLTDFDESEINAVEKVFSGCQVLICDFHRNQAWERWTSKHANSLGKKSEILSYLMKIGLARDMVAFHSSVESLKSSTIYQNNAKLKNYFDRIWYPQHKRWSKAFRTGNLEIVAGTNNGIESQHKLLKYSFMHRKTTNSLLGMLKIVIEEFFPARFKLYVDLNVSESGKFRKYSQKVPLELHNRPKKFVKHCLQRMESSIDIEKCDVTAENEIYTYKTLKGTYVINLGDRESNPCCNCDDWYESHMPCIHMFACMSLDGEVKWEKLSQLYLQSKYCMIDDYVVGDMHEVQDTPEHVFIPEKEVSNDISYNMLQRNARDALKKLQNLTYNLEDCEGLEKIRKTSEDLFNELGKSGCNNARLLPLRKRKALKKHCRRYGMKASILKKYSKLKISKKDVDQEEKEVTLQPLVKTYLPEGVDIRNNETLCDDVDKIWNSSTERLEARTIGPYIITLQSIQCIKSFLSDEVIDGFLHELVKDKQEIYHLNCIAMTAVFEGQQEIHHCLREVRSLMKYDTIIGAYNEGGCHWCLVIIHPKDRKLLYLNPLGTVHVLKESILLNWFNFMKSRFDAGIESVLPEKWILDTPCHAKQPDGSSCGVYVLKFAENYLSKRPLDFHWNKENIKDARRSLAVFLLSVSEPRTASDGQLPQSDYPDDVVHVLDESKEEKGGCCKKKESDDNGVDLNSCTEPIREDKTHHLRKFKHKAKRSSFFYPDVEKKGRKLYCKCQQPNDGNFMILCDLCGEWFHLECVELKKENLPKKDAKYFCPDCSQFTFPDMFQNPDPDDVVMEENFYVNKEAVRKHMPSVLSRLSMIVSSEKKTRNHPWMNRHILFSQGKLSEKKGYGYAIFSQPAILCTTHFVKQKFIKYEHRSAYLKVGTVVGLKDETMLNAMKNDRFLAELYVERVLVQEALCAILQNMTGCLYEFANKECSLGMNQSGNKAIFEGLKLSEKKKKELQFESSNRVIIN